MGVSTGSVIDSFVAFIASETSGSGFDGSSCRANQARQSGTSELTLELCGSGFFGLVVLGGSKSMISFGVRLSCNALGGRGKSRFEEDAVFGAVGVWMFS